MDPTPARGDALVRVTSPASAAPSGEALDSGRVSVAPLIDAVYPLDDVVAAFVHAETRGTLKVLLDPQV